MKPKIHGGNRTRLSDSAPNASKYCGALRAIHPAAGRTSSHNSNQLLAESQSASNFQNGILPDKIKLLRIVGLSVTAT